MQTRLDPFSLLERSDKWYLGGGKATLFAPAFPKFLDIPGFWDEAYFADIRLERLFCVLLLDEQARPVPLHRAVRRWTPDRLTHLYTLEGHPHLRLQEDRVITPNDTLACRLTLTNTGPEPARLNLLLWSLQAQGELPPDRFATTVEAVAREHDVLSFAHCEGYAAQDEIENRKPVLSEANGVANGSKIENRKSKIENPERVFVALGGDRLPDSWTVNLAETSETAPLWQVSVFPEKFRKGALAQEMQADAGWNPNGLLHLALHFTVEAVPGGSDAVTLGASLALDRETALDNLRTDMAGDVVAASRAGWEDFFASVPYFECSDPYLERYYWYRWYGLRLMTITIGAGQLPFPCVFEGPGTFRSHITYSAQCHMREMAWRRDPSVAMGSLENFLASQVRREDSQGDDGFLPGHLYLWRRDRGFYHADWGAAARQVYALTGDQDFVRRIYPGLARYAAYFDRERDREGVHLYDVVDQGETGQEYMSRYLFVDDSADSWRKIQIKGIDATCYLYELQRTLALFARLLDREDDADRWTGMAEATRTAIRTLMWDKRAWLFKDVHPRSLTPSPFKAAVGFYPFMSDIATSEHLPGLRTHLGDPTSFGTPYPVPASSVDDPYFDAEAEWKGKRTNCPWNGRVWPMTNSHVADALANAARTLDPGLRPRAADFIHRYVKMLFHDGDPKRPNCYEHYNPETGMPCLYRGVDDYQHSWIVDLILRHLVGVQPEPEGPLSIDPLPFAVRSFRAEGIPVRGHLVDVIWARTEGFVVKVDGRERLRLPEPQRVEIVL
jgi:hypothetical protein